MALSYYRITALSMRNATETSCSLVVLPMLVIYYSYTFLLTVFHVHACSLYAMSIYCILLAVILDFLLSLFCRCSMCVNVMMCGWCVYDFYCSAMDSYCSSDNTTRRMVSYICKTLVMRACDSFGTTAMCRRGP